MTAQITHMGEARPKSANQSTRLVTIPACSNHSGLLTVTVKLHWTCPKCGGPRGDTFRTQSYDGALPVQCDGWNNPCGHVDHYRDVRLEAQANGLNETGENSPKSTIQDDAVESFFAQIAAHDNERQAATEAGLPALERLIRVAERDTGQAGTVRLFLLGLYNGYRFPFNLVTLRGLDKSLFDDCMLVLTLDARATAKEVHQYFDNGGELFERWSRMAGGEK